MRGCVVLLLLAVPAFGDQVTLTNGDRLSGTLIQIFQGKLTLQSPLLGTVTVAMANVRTFATDTPVKLALAGGTVERQVLAGADGRITLAATDAEPARDAALSEVTAFNPPLPPPPPPPAPRVRRPSAWKGEVVAGLTSFRGNAVAENFDVKLGLNRRAGNQGLQLGGSYRLARQKDPGTGARVNTEDRWNVQGKYEHYYSPAWSWFLSTRADGDHINDLDLRLLTGGGTSYHLEHRGLVFSVDWGINWLREDYRGHANATDTVSTQLSYNLRAPLSRRFSFLHDLQWYPSVSDFGDFLLDTEASLRAAITTSTYASLGTTLQFDPTPVAGSQAINLKYLLGLGYQF
ncbi:MAG: DUF481 domain-containing protein [Armatimonadetes bacterium]|nr:DUF481 domain-containing protein [Armatimonadota bacterium]